MTRPGLNLEAVDAGLLTAADLRAGRDELNHQADVARRDGNPCLADNFARGAELVAVPEATVLRVYESLRPHRSSYVELSLVAEELERAGAVLNARLVRDARDAYQRCGTLAADPLASDPIAFDPIASDPS